MIQLETYRGTKSRHTCPECHSRNCFVRYVTDDGEYLSNDVGRCNRESRCGYHFTPKEFFEINPSDLKLRETSKKRTRRGYGFAAERDIKPETNQTDYISACFLKRTLTNYENNGFVKFLLDLFIEDREAVWQAVKNYLIGTTKDGKTVFWQIDAQKRIRTGKIIDYDKDSGKRRKDIFPNWIHAELKRARVIENDFNLSQCFFGSHLLPRCGKNAPVAIVEAEKTAVIASVCFPEFVWLAAGAKQNLSAEKLQKLEARKIILYPDADGFEKWFEAAQIARFSGLNINTSKLIENHATEQQKANGYDLADYLIEEQTSINRHNRVVDKYNSALEKVLSDENSFREFNRLLDERQAHLMLYGGLAKDEATEKVSDLSFVSDVVLKIAER